MTNNKEGKNNKNAEPQAEAADITLPKSEYDALKARADERDAYCDKYVRAHAEFENARKRMEKDKIEYCKYANEAFLLDFLPILDNLEISEKHIKEAKDFKAVQEGVDMIQLQIQKFLKDLGVERIETDGAKFDPHLHEPVEVVDADGSEEGDILAELKPGYRFNGRLLRPASVRIAKKKT